MRRWGTVANKVHGLYLQVKLGANAKFRFLDASHTLHGYYCFLRDENPQPVSATKNTVGVSLLGEEYGQDVSENCEVGWMVYRSVYA